jgi:ribosome-binding ATPase YchF (GTP1/OBG family)
MSARGEAGARDAASCGWKARNMSVQDGDVLHFRFNT